MIVTTIAIILLQAAAGAAPKVITAQSFATLGSSLFSSGSLTPFFTGLGQLIKQHPKLPNHWLRWILPLIGFLLATAIVVGSFHLGWGMEPFVIVGIYLTFVGAAFGSDFAFGLTKQASFLPTLAPGPEAPGIGSNKPLTPVPAPSAGTSAPIQMGNLPPSPNLPPS